MDRRAPGGKTLTGPVVLADLSTPDSLAAYKGKVRGAWVLPRSAYPLWNPDGPPMTAADSADSGQTLQARAALATADTSAAAVFARRQFALDLPYVLKAAGALGTLVDGAKEHALMTMSGSPNRVSPLPNLVIAHEDYAMLERQIVSGAEPASRGQGGERRSAGRRCSSGTPSPRSAAASGRGRWSSWARISTAGIWGRASPTTAPARWSCSRPRGPSRSSGVKPKRTIRFILFSGEEEGLLGSRAYAAAHAARGGQHSGRAGARQRDRTRSRGRRCRVATELEGLWRDLLAPVASLGADSVRSASKTGTDHLSFLPYGVPGFNFDQLPRGYSHTHHSQSDTYDKAVAGRPQAGRRGHGRDGVRAGEPAELLPRGPSASRRRCPRSRRPVDDELGVAGGGRTREPVGRLTAMRGRGPSASRDASALLSLAEARLRRGSVTVQVVSNPPRVLYTVVTVSRCGCSTPNRSSAILAVACSWKIPTLR